jgi:hypothetical protein
MFTFRGAILLMNMWIRYMMTNANLKNVEFSIFTTIIILHGFNLSIKLAFIKLLKL